MNDKELYEMMTKTFYQEFTKKMSFNFFDDFSTDTKNFQLKIDDVQVSLVKLSILAFRDGEMQPIDIVKNVAQFMAREIKTAIIIKTDKSNEKQKSIENGEKE